MVWLFWGVFVHTIPLSKAILILVSGVVPQQRLVPRCAIIAALQRWNVSYRAWLQRTLALVRPRRLSSQKWTFPFFLKLSNDIWPYQLSNCILSLLYLAQLLNLGTFTYHGRSLSIQYFDWRRLSQPLLALYFFVSLYLLLDQFLLRQRRLRSTFHCLALWNVSKGWLLLKAPKTIRTLLHYYWGHSELRNWWVLSLLALLGLLDGKLVQEVIIISGWRHSRDRLRWLRNSSFPPFVVSPPIGHFLLAKCDKFWGLDTFYAAIRGFLLNEWLLNVLYRLHVWAFTVWTLSVARHWHWWHLRSTTPTSIIWKSGWNCTIPIILESLSVRALINRHLVAHFFQYFRCSVKRSKENLIFNRGRFLNWLIVLSLGCIRFNAHSCLVHTIKIFNRILFGQLLQLFKSLFLIGNFGFSQRLVSRKYEFFLSFKHHKVIVIFEWAFFDDRMEDELPGRLHIFKKQVTPLLGDGRQIF